MSSAPAGRSPATAAALARIRTGLKVGASLAAALLLAAGSDRPTYESGAPSNEVLDLRGYKLAFEDRFATLDIAAAPGTGKRWYNHTPWSGDFGDAVFDPPGPDGPFSRAPHGLDITARRDATGRWRSGLISSRDRDGPEGRGFVQKYGYFEISAKLPSGMGTWPAFWLIGVDKSVTSAEIDVVEYYGGFPAYYHCVAHVWQGGKDVLARNFMIKVPDGSLSDRFNTYGVLIQPKTTTFYLNRRKVAELETPPEYRQPFYLLANLAIGSGWPTKDLTSPQVMQIAYIRTYRPIAPVAE
jgi:glycosyl hydrolase family 16